METIIPYLLILGITSALAGAFAGCGRGAIAQGVIVGLLLGPLGVIAMLGFDDRPLCPRCCGRLNEWCGHPSPKICQWCGLDVPPDGWKPKIKPKPPKPLLKPPELERPRAKSIYPDFKETK